MRNAVPNDRKTRTRSGVPIDARPLRRARVRGGWTLARIAEATGTSPATVSRVLTGQTQHAPTVKLVADALGVAMDDVIVEEAAV